MNQPDQTLPQKVADSAATLVGRRVVVTVLTVTGTVVVARALGTASFGELSSALAAYWLAAAASDFGVGLVLGRDLAAEPERRGRLLRASFMVQGLWSLLPAVVLVALALSSGLETGRGEALLIFAPSVAIGGLAGARQVFFALYRIRRLAVIDIATTALQLGGMIVLVEAGGGVAAVAIAMSAASILNTLLIARAALALVDHGRPTGEDRRTLMRRALPLGVVSFSSSIYFSVDLVLLGWLTDAHSLGEYAAACKILNLLVTLPALLMSAALPGLATTAGDPAALGVLVSRIWHWLAVVGVPVCAAAAVFAKPIVAVAFGPSYSGAVPLVRILALAAAVALLTNVLVTMLIARSTIRVMVIGNAAAIALNVVGNVVLVPSYGVAAAAWLTVATELFVCVIALGALHRLLPATRALSVTARPALAVAAFVATGVALAPWPVVGIPIATAVFVLLVVALRAWPNELHLPRWRATRP